MEKIITPLITTNIRLIDTEIKLLLVVLSFILVFFSGAKAAEAASLYFSPSSGTFTVGKTFSVSVYTSSTDQAMNAASGIISFPEDKLEVASLSKSGSIISLWVLEPSFSNAAGTVNFEGIVLNPGFTGAAGKIITVNFKVKAAGTALLNFSSGSVLANDGKGTNILASLGNAQFNLILEERVTPTPTPVPTSTTVPPPPQIFSETHPDQNKWYSNNSPKFSWTLTNDITGVSLLFDQKSDSNPGNLSDGLFDSKAYQNIEEGIWYLHLKLKNNRGWSKTSHYKIQIDLTPPLPFEINILDGKETTNPQPTLLFETKDELSGLSHYEMKIGEGDTFTFKPEEIKNNLFKMPYQAPGTHSISIKAIDMAGNVQEAKSEILIKPTVMAAVECPSVMPKEAIRIGTMIISYGIIIIILLIILFLLIVGIIFFWYKIKLMRTRLRKEIKEAEESLHGGFDILRDDIREELEELESIKKIRALTPREKELRGKLIKDLNIVEKYIRKEIKDVEEELK